MSALPMKMGGQAFLPDLSRLGGTKSRLRRAKSARRPAGCFGFAKANRPPSPLEGVHEERVEGSEAVPQNHREVEKAGCEAGENTLYCSGELLAHLCTRAGAASTRWKSWVQDCLSVCPPERVFCSCLRCPPRLQVRIEQAEPPANFTSVQASGARRATAEPQPKEELVFLDQAGKQAGR